MPSPEEYKADKEAAEQAKLEELADSIPTAQTSSSKALTMFYWCVDTCPDCTVTKNYCWCGPSSGASIGAYYKYYHSPQYTGLPEAYPNKCPMYLELYTTMKTRCDNGWTYAWNYGPGFLQMARNHGYYNFDYDLKYWPSDYYPTIKYYIDCGWPTALCCAPFYGEIKGDECKNGRCFPPTGGHFVSVKGYYDGWHGYDRVLICTDSYSRTDWLYINYGISGLFPWYITIMD